MYGTVSVPPLPESTHPFLIKTPPRRRTHHSCVHAGEFAGDIKDRMDSFVTFCSTSSPCGDMTKVSSSVQVDGETAALRKGGVGIDSSEERLWNNWISDYSAGAWGSQATPPPPLLSFLPSLSESATPLATPPFDHSTSNSPLLDQGPTTPPPIDDYVLPSLTPCGPDPSLFTDRSPEALLLFYKNNGFFPAMPGRHEEQRIALMRKYGLNFACRREAINRICRLAKAHFKTDTVVVSLVFQSHTVLAAEVGWGGDEPTLNDPLRDVPISGSICTHAIAHRNGRCFILPDAASDWRFQENPFVKKGLRFLASANIDLPLPLVDFEGDAGVDSTCPATLPVGTICVIDSKSRPVGSFTEEDQATLKDFASLISREFQLGHESVRREMETKQAAYLATLLERTLVYPASFDSNPLGSTPPSSALFAEIARELCNLTGADNAALIDVRQYRLIAADSALDTSEPSSLPTTSEPPVSGHHRSNSGSSSSQHRPSIPTSAPTLPSFSTTQLDARNKIKLLGSHGNNVDAKNNIDFVRILSLQDNTETSQTIVPGLNLYLAGTPPPFSLNPLASLSPSVLSSVSIPIYDQNGRPSLFLAVSSNKKHFRFDDADTKFITSAGSICIGALLRDKASEADVAKTRFVCSISHELRTPIHGARSNLELIREFATPQELDRLSPLLLASETCLDSLRDVLDDVLEFAKFSNDRENQEEFQHARKQSLRHANLERVVEDAICATWVRSKRVDIVNEGQATPLTKVDVVLVVQEDIRWGALMDIGGIKRVLLNILGNSQKFTASGHIKITLRQLPVPLTNSLDRRRTCCLDLEDTGIGMSEDFLQDSLFTPFVQSNSFASGIGIGMSICKTIIRRLGGKIDVSSALGKGTTIRLTFPLEFVDEAASSTQATVVNSPSSSRIKSKAPRRPTTAASKPITFRSRIISDELSSLFDPSPGLIVVATPPFDSEKSEFNFSFAEAVEKQSKMTLPKPNTLGLGKQKIVALEERKRSIRCLVAEDNRISRLILAKLLKGKGVPFVEAENGQAAVDRFKEEPFQLILLDFQMPIKDGIEAAREIRAHERENGLEPCRIVALTGLSKDAGLEEGLIDLWLIKGGGKNLSIIVGEIVAAQERFELHPQETQDTQAKEREI